jgi:ribosome-binding factor A
MATIRQQRVSELLYEELSILISNELEDPRLTLIDVTHVAVSRDLSSARVYVFHQDDEIARHTVLNGLRNATPFLRRQLAQRCNLRLVPELFFQYDDTPERAARIDELLASIAEERQINSDGEEATQSGEIDSE